MDGFRLDAAWAVRERAPEFWPHLIRLVRRINPDVGLIAEGSALDPYYALNGFDATYDRTSKLGEWAWSGVFGRPDESPQLASLRVALTNSYRGFPETAQVLHFLNNNDIGARFITRHGIEQARDAAVLLLTVPGIPVVYDGDEVGAQFEPYAPGARVLREDASQLSSLYSRLTRLGRLIPALRSGDLRMLATDHDDAVLAFVRSDELADPQVLVVINFGAIPLKVRILPRALPAYRSCAFATARGPADLLTDRVVSEDPTKEHMQLNAHEAHILPLPRCPANPG